jgi:hypothetical protein
VLRPQLVPDAGVPAGERDGGLLGSPGHQLSDASLLGACLQDASLQAPRSASARYDGVFRGHHEERVQVAQSRSSNETFINDALSQAINAALGDDELIRCLASEA